MCMRFRHLLFPILLLLTLSDSLRAQKIGYKTLSSDSLAGFDAAYHHKAAMAEGISGDVYKGYMEGQKRAFVNQKYDLGEKIEVPDPHATNFSQGKAVGNGNFVLNAPCSNEGFESGNLGSWTIERGQNTSSQIYPTFTSNITSSPGTQAVVLTTPITDFFVGTIPASPLGGSMVARINNSVVGTAAIIRISQTFPVTLTNYLYDFAYWAVMQNAASHNCQETPYMAVRVRNFTGTLQACPNFSIVAPSTGAGGCSGIGPLTWNSVGSGTNQVRSSNGWQKFSIDLTSYIGQNVTIEVLVGHCSLTGHFGYSYFDSNCNTMNLTVNGTNTVSMPTTTVMAQANCGSSATLTAPSGLSPYQWFGPTGFSGSTNTTIVTAISGNYTLNMSPTGICNPPIQRIINLTFPPPTTITANPATLCASGGGPTSSTLTVTGASSYTWAHGGTGSTSVVSPTATTIYSVSVQTGTCIGTRTIDVVVSPNPTITISNPNPNMCTGGSVTLTANGASTFTWQPGSLTGSQVVVSPTTPGNNVFTVTGTSGSCIDTETTIVSVGSSTAITLFNVTGSVCAGNPVTLVAATFGYSSFTWTPTNPQVTGNPGIVTPTANTIYTVIASIAGGAPSCTNTATISVIADPGPSMTVAASPTITCPGVNATLTAVAPTAVGNLTWTPGPSTGTSYVVAPSVSTVYSVTGRNSNNCPSTYTINKLVAPIPTLNISPPSPSVCIGNTITLTASGGVAYTWSPGGSNATTIAVSPTVNTTYSLSGSNGTCSTMTTTTVQVVPTPTVNASASSTAICVGQQATLSAIGATSYTWLPGPVTGGTITVSPTSNTTYTVTGNTGGCSASRTLALVVNPLPTVNVTGSPNPICRGNCSTLTPTGAQTYTYLSTFTNVVCPTVTTTYSVSGTSSLGCQSAQPGTVSIVVNNTPNVTFIPASPSVCLGSTVTVTAIGGTGYTWQPGGMTGGSQGLSPTITTIYTVTATNAFGCQSQRTLQVIVLPTPTVNASASPSVICSGSSSTLSATGATTYTWMPGSLTGSNVTVTPPSTTNYTVTGSLSGCTRTAAVSVSVNITPTVNASVSPTAICRGDAATLAATGATSYTWLPGPINTASAVVTPTSNTTYTVTGATNNCNSTRTVALVVNQLPTITVVASPSNICRGSCSTLNPSGAQTYTVLSVFSTVVCPTVNTTFSVVGTSSAGCISAQPGTVSIVVNPTPNISFIPANPSVCPGSSITVSAIGGVSYTWNPGNLSGNSQSLGPAVTTVYTVQGRNAFFCVTTRTLLVFVLPQPTINVSASPTVVCTAGCSTLSPTGAVSYTYLNGGPVVCPTVSTTYSVIGRGSNNCVSQTPGTVVVTVSSPPTIVLNPTSATICSGGSVNVSATGGTSYTWNPGSLTGTSQVLSPGTSTTYTVTGINAQGCTGQATILITVVPTPTITASASPTAVCRGSSSTLIAIGAASFTWNPGNIPGNPISVNPNVTTTYTVTGSTSGCTGTGTVTLVVNPLPTISVASNPTAVCAGSCATLTPTGASTYTYLNGGPAVCPTVATTYSVSGTSSLGCVSASPGTVNVNTNQLPTLTLTPSTASICAGSSVNITATGANTYTWNPGNLTGNSQNLGPAATTVYTVTGTSASGCIGSRTISIQVVPSPTVTASANPTAICRGATAVLTASGATSYTWNPGGVGNPISVNPTVTTTYTVTGNAAGCTGTRTLTLVVNPLPTISVASNPTAVCAGACATLTPSGASTYTYLNGGPVVCPTIATTYSVSGTSSLGCVSASPGTVNVNTNPLPTLTLTPSSASICAGGSVNITANGATSYTWNPGSLTGNSQNLGPAATTVYTVTGASAGCTGSQTISIQVVPNPTVTASANPTAICMGATAVLTASGATSYTWNPGGPGNPISVNPTITTTYTVIGNAAGCSGTRTLTLVVNPLPTITVASNPTAVCAGSCATLTPSGASTYTYLNGGPAVCPTVATTYSVSGTSSLGCVSASPGTVNVNVNPLPTLTLTPSSASICAGSSVNITATGANTYTWNPGNLTGATQALSPTVTTVYTVTGASAAGCIGTRTISIQVVPSPTVTASANPTAICRGASAVLTASGATSYSWNPGNISGNPATVNPTITTTFTVTGTAGGCTGTRTITVVVNPLPTITVVSNPTAVCVGSCATLTPSGASTYTYAPAGPVVCPGAPTIFSVSGTSSLGCVSASAGTVNVGVIALPIINLTPSSASICAGGNVNITATGGSTYTWNPGNLNGATQNLSPAATTIYTVNGTSAAGCVGTQTIQIQVVPNPTISASANPTAICRGLTSVLTASGATSYSWNPGNISGNPVSVNPTITTTYTITGNAAGCTGTRTITVVVNPLPTITVVSNPTAFCGGGCATLTPSGAQTYTYLNGGPVVCPTITTTYSVSGTSSLGCVSSPPGTVSVIVNPIPSITLSATSTTLCAGATTTITASGAANYTWMPGGFGGTVVALTPTATTTFTVSGRLTATSCIGQQTINIVVIPSPTITASASSGSICIGSSATLTANGASSYTWMPGALGGSQVAVTPTITTTYTVTGSSGACTGAPAFITVTVVAPIGGTAVASPPSVCSNGCTTLTLTGYTGSIQWESSTSSGVGPFVNISGGTTTPFTVCSITGTRWFRASVTNVCGSAVSTVVQVTLNPTPSLTVTPNPANSCVGSTISITASGASTYTWAPASGLSCTNCASPVASPASTTVYTVTGMSSLGCTATAAATVVVNPLPTIVANSSSFFTCAGETSTLTATGGVTYTWFPGGITGSMVTVSPTVSTTYTVIGTSSLGCNNSDTWGFFVNPLPTVVVVPSPTALCAGSCVTLSPSGAMSYTYLNGGPIDCPTVTTTYSVTGTDFFGCTSAQPGTVTVSVSPIPTIAVTPQSSTICAGNVVTMTATGASTYTWNPGNLVGSSQSFTPSATTVYTITGENAAGCQSLTTATIVVVPIPTVIASASPATICIGAASTLTSTGAASYTWLPGGLTGSNITVNPTSTTIYTVTGVTGNCSSNNTVQVTVNPLPTITAVAGPTAGCPGFCSTITPSGAQSYTYLNGGPVVCPTITATYSITGTSSLGCVSAAPATVAIVLNPNPTLSVAVNPGTVCALQSATISAGGSATGYTWQPGTLVGSTHAVNPSATTVYTVTGILGNCTVAATTTLFVNPNPTVNVNAAPNSICIGSSSTLTATGATNYTWTPGAFTGSQIAVNPTVTTSYVVVGENGSGCSDTKTITVTVGTVPVITITANSNTICAGSSATLTANGTLAYTWSPGGMTTSVVVVNPAGTTTYSVFGSNGPGCSNTQTFQLVVSPIPSVTISPATATICEGFTTTLVASGATSYTWEPGTITGTQAAVSPTSTTVYTLTAESAGCATTGTAMVTVLPLPTITIVSTSTSVCVGGSATLTANGASNYTWFPGGTTATNIVVNPGTTTTYTVAGIGSNNCPNIAMYTLSVLPLPTVVATASSPSVCIGSSATLTATGATSYTWEPGTLTGSNVVVTPNTPTTYTVTGDNGACSGVTFVTIGINPLPTITAVSSTTVACGLTPVSFTATGANTYTWMPPSLTGSTVTDNPAMSTTYTVTGEDANGCTNTANITVSVNPSPTMIAIASPTSICLGDSVVLSGSGALSFTWNPTGLTTQTISDFPTVTTIYTLSGTDAIGCIGSGTVQVGVFPIPTVAVLPVSSTVCAGSPITFTATGATNYSWTPGGQTGSVITESPTTNTTYTVVGDNGGTCFSSATLDVFVNPLPANVTATVSGTITCASPSVNLTGASTDTNVSYSWSGPSGYTSNVQNPTGITIWGVYTLSVMDLTTFCVATATVDVPTDNSIPSVTATASGSITCAVPQVTLMAANVTFSPGYAWSGPSSFSSTLSVVSVSVAGVYTVTVTDLTSNCATTATVSIGTHTDVLVTASISPATCSAGVSNNDGTIMVANFASFDKFDLVAGTSYTGSATYATAINIPTSGVLTANLANPTSTVAYTLRIFDAEGCIKDTTLVLVPVDCSVRSIGIAKAVASVVTNTVDGTYNVVYNVVVRNYDTLAPLDRVVITDNLASAFVSPAQYQVISVNVSGGSFSVDAAYNGAANAALTTTGSALAANGSATISVAVKVTANGFFGPFNNSASGSAVNSISVTVSDVSTDGTNPDPDLDGNPNNNSVPTPLMLTPDLFFGITKEGAYALAGNATSYDVTYTVTVFNRGNDTLKNVVVTDSLYKLTIPHSASYTMRSGPVTSGGLIANASYNGNTDVSLLAAGSRLNPGEIRQIVFSLNVVPDTVTVIANSALGRAISSTSSIAVNDISNNGSNPDTNGNRIWNEAQDNVPTVLVLPSLSSAAVTVSLFIPGGFSPDGDGVNDWFVVKGLPEDAVSELTIFNRWGNRVYQHPNYKEAEPWDGRPNIAGTMGKTRVAQGTYFFILHIKRDDMKPITGFIVVQY
jgi:gliding motility-associated-like protein